MLKHATNHTQTRCKTLEMKIEYKKKYLNTNLIYALLFIITLLPISACSSENWHIIIGILTPTSFILKYFYQKQNKYLTIENGTIKINNILGKTIRLNELQVIEKYAGDYILKARKKNLKIDTTIIESKSLSDLDSELKKLNVEWE